MTKDGVCNVDGLSCFYTTRRSCPIAYKDKEVWIACKKGKEEELFIKSGLYRQRGKLYATKSAIITGITKTEGS